MPASPAIRTAAVLSFLLLSILQIVAAQSSILAAPPQPRIDDRLHRDVHQVWNTSSGLPQDTVRQFLQTRDGFLWMATEGGLVRFDGYDFAVFDKRNTQAIASDLINALYEDRASHLWIATAAGLTERSGNTFRHYSTHDGLPSDNVWAIAQDATGRLWAATAGGLAYRDIAAFQSAPSTGSFNGRMTSPFALAPNGTLWIVSTSTVTRIDPAGHLHITPLASAEHDTAPTPIDLAVAPDSSLWVGTLGSLLHLDAQGSLTSIALPSMPDLRLHALALDQHGTLWLGTILGLFSRPASAPTQPWRHFDRDQGLPAANITRLFADPSGTLWIATDTGLLTYEKARFAPAFEQEGFLGGDLLTLFRDREGDLWAGSDSAGAAVLRHPAFTTFTRRDGLPSDVVRSVLAGPSHDPAQTLWFGTSAGLSSLSSNTFHTQGTAQGLASDEILALAEAAAPTPPAPIWIGTPDGLSYLHANSSVTLTASDGLPGDAIRSLLLSRSRALWIGTSHGLACLPQADPAQAHSIRTFTQSNGLASNVIGSLLEDADGSLWVATLNGLTHLSTPNPADPDHVCDPSAFTAHSFAAREGLTSPIVTALGRSAQGTVWIGTSGGGLFAYQGNHIARIGSPSDYAAGRLPSTIYSIVEDTTGYTWLGSATGVDRIRTRDLMALTTGTVSAGDVPVAHFDVADGLRIHDLASNGHPEAALTASGDLWFATLKGASVVDTHDPALTLGPPPVAIEAVTVDDVAASTPPGQTLVVPAGHGRIAFHYAGLSLAQPAKVRYRYQLDRFDRNWIDAGTRRTAYYTNIPPGSYTFRVLASMDGGAWSATAAEVPFTIAPHYYQTWWFYTMLALLLLIIAWQLYLYRLRQVELRFHAVLAERGRIAREIHDTLAQDIVGISVQLELVSRLMSRSVDQALLQLQETRALVRKSLADARSSIWDLRSSASGNGDLPARLRALARRLIAEAKAEAKIALDLHITGTYRPFPEAQESELLRIAQEAITNAVRHAQPRTIRVTLIYHAAGARLEVHDDGKGFDVPVQKSGPPGHYGIRGMYERADRARATLTIRSTPGSGTDVTAEMTQP